jgi:hypothetical protein
VWNSICVSEEAAAGAGAGGGGDERKKKHLSVDAAQSVLVDGWHCGDLDKNNLNLIQI